MLWVRAPESSPLGPAALLVAPWVWAQRWSRWALFALGAVSAVNMLVIAGVGLEAPERGDVLIDFAYARLLQGRLSAIAGASNLGLEFGIVRGGTLGPLVVWMLGGAHILSRQLHELVEGAPRLAQT